jgi:hypothetical protein
MKEFSKKMLFADYFIAIALILGYFICVAINGLYAKSVIDTMINSGMDVSCVTVPQIFSLDGFGVLLGSWILQLGVSSGAYYMMTRSDHRIQLPIKLIQDMPEDIKENVDMTQIITTVLSTSDN